MSLAVVFDNLFLFNNSLSVFLANARVLLDHGMKGGRVAKKVIFSQYASSFLIVVG
ncbi:hypothetical protein HPTD01_1438 [Halomonas sp. TD01]|nr:hypothetical protein GME_09109 [Halomonas sp. TD01]CAH1042960.1 hypothetical protein HPTD01_1438 [Halomonas sp. TD01]